MPKKRCWSDDYVRYGFTCTTDKDGIQRPQCILCYKMFSNSNLKPSKLSEHFKRLHGGEDAGHTIDKLSCMRARFNSRGTITTFTSVSVEKPLLQASYHVAYLCAKKKKPHNIAEELVKPCALEIAKIVLGSDAYNKVKQIPLSNDVIRSRIKDMSEDILQQIVEDIKNSPVKVSIQLDESTDVDNYSQLMVYIRYVKEQSVIEEFLFCEPLDLTTRGVDVFNHVNNFFKNHEISINIVGSICTDGAPAMLGKHSGFIAYIKKEVPEVTITHCMLHRHALASKTLTRNLMNTLSTAVAVVIYIKGRALNHRIFRAFCEEIGDMHTTLLFHTEVRWLSRGRMLSRVFEMRAEIIQFLTNQRSNLVEEFGKRESILRLAYLADIFSQLNELNISLQGFGVNTITAREKLSAFISKLSVWIKRVGKNNFANFPLLEEIVSEIEFNTIAREVATHLHQL
ncbi:hypothetical protein CBL_21336, partial [Carabus blaptoides fortunei]